MPPFADLFLKEVSESCSAMNRQDIHSASDTLFQAWASGRTVYTCGNGGSASTASHFAADLVKFTRVAGKPQIRAFSLCDNAALISAFTNDEGFGSIFAEQIRPVFCAGDILVAFSVHGGVGADKAGAWSQNLIIAADLAHQLGGKVVAFAGFGGGRLREIADVTVLVAPPESGQSSTPLVEGMHVVVHHLLVQHLLTRIRTYGIT
jgi:D-sedoheptulose 7-phosphate isomerase